MGISSIAALRPSITQVVSYSTATAITNAFGAQTYVIRLVANSACHVLVSEAASVTAATVSNAMFLPANWVDYIIVSPGQKLSVIQAATNGLVTATAGTLIVTEMI